jgi:hypothetical protein
MAGKEHCESTWSICQKPGGVNPHGGGDHRSGAVGATPGRVCCAIVIILYADDRIASKVYFEEYLDQRQSSSLLKGKSDR